jgi:diguanylate cyclase (GGDEF)-like protein
MPAAIVVARDARSELSRRALADAGFRDPIVVASIDDAIAWLDRDGEGIEVALVELGPNERAELPALARLARRRRAVPVVVVVSPDGFGAALRAGACDGVTRPVRRPELVSRLQAARRLQRRVSRHTARERKLSDAIEQLARSNRDLERLVCIDALTGIANRRHAFDLLEAECRRSARDATPLAIVMIDLDSFHAYNERYGHPGGDRCLQRVAATMVHALRRPSDFLGRYGGEEFVAVLPATDASGAAIVAERMRAAVEALAIPHVASPCARIVTISAGFANRAPDGGAEQLVAAADAALLAAKDAGRNQVVGNARPVDSLRVPPGPWRRFAPVIADPWFADRIPRFLAATRAMAVQLAAGSDGALSAARGLATGARDYGLDQLRGIATQLDRAARAAATDTVRELARELIDYVDHVQVVYRRRGDGEIAGPRGSA